MRHLLFLATICILIVGCKSDNSQTDFEIDPQSGVGFVKSINDTVAYYFDPKTNKMSFVMNLKYHKNKYYTTKISNDTVELGEIFIGEVKLDDYNGKITLHEPIDTVVDSRLTNHYTLLMKYQPETTGQYNFRGTVSYDSIQFPFLYKFLVVDKGTRQYKYDFVGKMRHSSE
jgi:hypothetical protein